MRLDIRLPIGVLFAVIGVLLTVFGATSDTAIYARSLGHNVNLGWGVLLFLFGAVFTWFGVRGMRASAPGDAGSGPT
jgi:protein-S-isoprenylcysteine O-methyltransferase Ste14